MTREQIKEQFPDATDDQITAILNINGTDITAAKKNNVDAKTLKKLQEDSAAYEKLKEAGLTDEEKIQKALADAKAKEAEFSRKSNQLEVEKILVEAGLAKEDYENLLEGLVTEDAEISKSRATNLASMLSKQKEAVEKKAKEDLMDHTKGGGAGSGAGAGAGAEEKTSAEKIAEKIYGGQKQGESVLSHYM